MQIVRAERFKKDFKRLPRDIHARFPTVLERFVANPRHPSLHPVTPRKPQPSGRGGMGGDERELLGEAPPFRAGSNGVHVKKMEGVRDIWELRVSDSYRVTFQFVQEGILLRRVGPHDILRQP